MHVFLHQQLQLRLALARVARLRARPLAHPSLRNRGALVELAVAELAMVQEHLLLFGVDQAPAAGVRALHPQQEGEEVVDLVEHVGVGGLEVFVGVVGDDALLSDAEDAFLRDLDAQVGNRVGFPVAEASDDGLPGRREDLVHARQQLYLELVGRLLDDLPREGAQIPVGTHEERPGRKVLSVCIGANLLSSTSLRRKRLVCPYWPMALAVM